MLSAGFSYISVVLVDDELSVISMFIIYVVTKLNCNRYCNNIGSHARSLYVMFVKFVNSADSVSYNEISNIYIYKC